MWQSLRARINAPVFLIALVCGFTACCFAGHYCAENPPFQNFRRFYQPLSAETYFYPTISQMVSLAKQSLDSNKKLVIVGGNSVAMGRGQGKDLWTEKLQEILGPQYKVLNFAQVGMPVFTGPYIAFWCLAEKYKNVCYVGVGDDLFVNNLETPFEGYPYWEDAYFKRLLPTSVWWQEESMHERHSKDKASLREATEERKIGALLDAVFYFRDLWTTVGYKYFFTVWTPKTASTFLKPRIDYPDEDPPPYPVETRLNTLDLVQEHNLATANFKVFFERKKIDNELQLSAENLQWVYLTAQDTVPMPLRSRVLYVHVNRNPQLLSKAFSAEELVGLNKIAEASSKIYSRVGCRALLAGKDYEPQDYLDGCHLSGSGGAKLAASVSSRIKELLP